MSGQDSNTLIWDIFLNKLKDLDHRLDLIKPQFQLHLS
jgi:hypothetical protein